MPHSLTLHHFPLVLFLVPAHLHAASSSPVFRVYAGFLWHLPEKKVDVSPY